MATLSETIQFGDEIFDVDALVASSFDTTLIKTAYKYSFINNGKVDFGLSVGVSTFIFDFEVVAEGSAGGGPSEVQAESEQQVAPVPVLGLHVDYTIRPGLILKASGEIFDLDVDDFEGKVTDFRVSIDWYPFEHFGFGAGFNDVRLDFSDVGIPGFMVDYDFDGLMAYASYVF